MSDSFGSKTSSSGAGSSPFKSAAAAAAPKPLRSAPAPAAKRSFPAIAFLVTGVVFLLAVLVFIAYDRLSTPNVQLPSSMPVASEVQDWNNSSRDGLAPGGGNLTAVDPVSKEAVDPNTTPYKINIGSSWFYFTSEAHLKAFTDDPFKYVKVNINVKLLKDGSAPPDEGQGGGKAAGPAEEAAADNSDLYQQIPAPQTESAAGAGSAAEKADAAGARQDAANSGASASGQPPAAESAGGSPDASLYQQIPPPADAEGRNGVPNSGFPAQNMNSHMPPPPPPPPPPFPPFGNSAAGQQQMPGAGQMPGASQGQMPGGAGMPPQPGGYPGVGEAIEQNTPVGMPL